MSYRDLRDFVAQLEAEDELRRVHEPVSPHLEMTALCDRVLRAGGPALLFENPTGHTLPMLANLFGTTARVARAMGVADVGDLRRFGEVLARLKEPEAPHGLREMAGLGDLIKSLWHMSPREVRHAPCQAVVIEGEGRGPGATAHPALLAGRRGTAHHLGPGHHPGAAQAAAEPGHLPPAGALAQPAHHALAGAPRRRAGLPRTRSPAPR